MVLEHIKISRRAFSKFRKNTSDFPGGKTIIKNISNFPGDLVKTFVRTHDFPGERNTITTVQIF